MESETPFKCNVCPKSYEREQQLQMHSYTHGEKPYSCDNCNKRFSTMKGWAGHKETKVCTSNENLKFQYVERNLLALCLLTDTVKFICK